MRKENVAAPCAVSSTRRLVLVAVCMLTGNACSVPPDARPVAVVDSARDSLVIPEVLLPIALDTAAARVLEFWPLAVPPGRQVEETRRIVEHLQADLALVAGFETATLLASGDGAALLLAAAWRDSASASKAHASLAEWLRAERDTAILRRRIGTATPRVRVRRTVGTAPLLGDTAMVLFTRYALKPGHSFGALAELSDSNLAMRVLQDTAAHGGATVVAQDSGAVYVVVQARTAAALDPTLQVGGPMPFWAPFAARAEHLLAVVAVVHRR